jgi:signal peptidase II
MTRLPAQSSSALPLRRFIQQLWMLFVVLALVLVDWTTKVWMFHVLGPGDVWQLWPGMLHLAPTWNQGMAFSLFANQPQVLLAVVSVLVVGLSVGVLVWQHQLRIAIWAAWAMILAGAWGNWLDRLAFGAVRDFISVVVIHFPVFNVADSLVCMGVGLVVLETLWGQLPEVAPPLVATQPPEA